MKQRFKIEDKRVIHASWEDGKDWTEIYLEKQEKEMMDQAYEILAPKDNKNLPCYLMVFVPKKKTLLVDQKRNRNEFFGIYKLNDSRWHDK